MSMHPCQNHTAPDAACRLLRPALAYAARGWPVFPCRPNKQPFTQHGFKDATCNREALVRWWTENPGAGIGTPTGAVSGFIAIDLDFDAGKGLDGVSKFADLVKAVGAPIRTRKHRTPRGGIHLLFAHPPGDLVKNSASAIAAGVDTRGDGGFIILPPSKNETGEYRIETDTDPVPLPSWLCRLFREKGIMATPAMPARTAPRTMPPGCPPSVSALVSAGAPDGQRNDRALSVAIQLRDEGHDRATVAACLDFRPQLLAAVA